MKTQQAHFIKYAQQHKAPFRGGSVKHFLHYSMKTLLRKIRCLQICILMSQNSFMR